MTEKRINKRGVSEVVATVLIVLVTVTAGVIIINFVIPFVRDNLNKGSECIMYGNYFKFEEKIDGKNYNCYKISPAGEYRSSVRNNGGSDVNPEKVLGFQIVLSGSQSQSASIKVPVSENSPVVTMYDPTQTQVSIPGSGEVYTYKFNLNEGYRNSKIYPMLKSGKICEASDEISLEACGQEIN